MIPGAHSIFMKEDTHMYLNGSIGVCPHCGSEVQETLNGWACVNPGCRFIIWRDNFFFTAIGKEMTGRIAEALLTDGRVRMENCRSVRTGRRFDADVLLSAERDGKAHFSLGFDGRDDGRGKEHVSD